ncbi:alpha/beta hydrolase [Eubacteriales bacterium OttesenSCG-928-N13]|nr:alpha/beta hydrolase [Eubacteriales bacterium OttesenSCG-928-N13]
MKKRIRISANRPLITLMEGLTYTNAPHWYGVTARPLQLDLLLPRERDGLAPMPLIVWLCGGAFQTMSRSAWLPEMMAYAQAGYVVACVDYRVTSDAPFPAAVLDVKAAIRYLRAHAASFAIDPNRVAVMGESAGGYLACMAALADSTYDQGDWLDQSSGVQAVVDFYGKLDMDASSMNNRANPEIVRAFMSDLADQGRVASPFHLVTSASPPFLIFHGDADPLVPIAESDQLYQALSTAGVRADYYILEGSGHGSPEFYQPEIQRIILDFLQGTLASK